MVYVCMCVHKSKIVTWLIHHGRSSLDCKRRGPMINWCSSFLARVLTLGHRASVLPHTHIVKVLLQCSPISLRPSYTHHHIASLSTSHLTPYPLLLLHLSSFASLAVLWLLVCLSSSWPRFTLTCLMAIYLVLTSLHSASPSLCCLFKPFCAT